MDDVYRKLQEKIDGYSVGFSATKSGIELKILQKLVTPEEAALYLILTRKLEPISAIADRAAKDPITVASLLDSLTQKGFTFPRTKPGTKYYAAAPFMHGFFEHQAMMKRMDKELALMYEAYFKDGFTAKTHALRTIPIHMPVTASGSVLPYDDVKKIIGGKEKIGVIPCACATKMRVLESGCKRPENVCISFDFYAEYEIEELKVGRWITREEAYRILDESKEAGLVHQIGGTSENTECICNCCPECCQTLRVMKRHPTPARLSGSNYFAEVVADQCTLCERCIDRCPMKAISAGQESVGVDLDRCLGCGLCTSACPVEALQLRTKPADKVKPPPSPEKYKFMRASSDFYKDME
jgi:Na+-translocating ferredoxin:NAD+ oxidoreductase subunit B